MTCLFNTYNYTVIISCILDLHLTICLCLIWTSRPHIYVFRPPVLYLSRFLYTQIPASPHIHIWTPVSLYIWPSYLHSQPASFILCPICPEYILSYSQIWYLLLRIWGAAHKLKPSSQNHFYLLCMVLTTVLNIFLMPASPSLMSKNKKYSWQ